jgi:hypothetical protein
MRTRAAVLSSAVVVSVVGVLAFAAPAYAETTPVTVQVDAGERAITVPGAVAFTPIESSAEARTITLAIGAVTVTDNLGGTAIWSVEASATDFAVTGGGASLGATSSYASTQATVVGTATVTPTANADLATVGTVQSATAVNGANTATWNPTISLNVPIGAPVGTYESVITHSLI